MLLLATSIVAPLGLLFVLMPRLKLAFDMDIVIRDTYHR